ncbi:hypothetical protein ATE84_0073 [Aquimarina sp. MAR_2010_214]|uniref:hypothetical protein n=1 Tax=Aquimarina sp. MAR_2010_214 TaxID=1250026 RepID=UPI000C70F15C|nr:hypothetical protein [Aquimarina sp. MAR_2010_214]PKV48087.1 hypothetical protein ATE84_0073 [Aquimarina sp. MAR_2010_214]
MNKTIYNFFRAIAIWTAISFGVYQLNKVIAYIVFGISCYLIFENLITRIRDIFQLKKWYASNHGKAFFIYGRKDQKWNKHMEDAIVPNLNMKSFYCNQYGPILEFEELSTMNIGILNGKIKSNIGYPIMVQIENNDLKITNYRSLFDDLVKKRKDEEKFISIMNKYV